MKKPVEAIERLRYFRDKAGDIDTLLAYLDSLPEWPADLTRERLEELASPTPHSITQASMEDRTDALRRLAELAPRGKWKVHLWKDEAGDSGIIALPLDRIPNIDKAGYWRKVGEAEIDA